jgi:hypothetical protein
VTGHDAPDGQWLALRLAQHGMPAAGQDACDGETLLHQRFPDNFNRNLVSYTTDQLCTPGACELPLTDCAAAFGCIFFDIQSSRLIVKPQHVCTTIVLWHVASKPERHLLAACTQMQTMQFGACWSMPGFCLLLGSAGSWTLWSCTVWIDGLEFAFCCVKWLQSRCWCCIMTVVVLAIGYALLYTFG